MIQRLIPASLAVLLVACGGPQLPSPAVVEPIVAAQAPPEPSVLEPGTSWGTIAISGPADADARNFHEYAVWGPPGTLARITLWSPSMDVMLRVELPDGRELFNDDFEGTNSRLQFALPDTGSVRVFATTYAPGVYGKYRIDLAVLDPSAGTALPAEGVVEGSLFDYPPVFMDTPDAEIWFTATRGERLRMRVTSPDFDTVATVYSPDGISWTNDDAHDVGIDASESIYDSTVQFVAPDDGLYQLVVASYAEPGDGNFRVVATRQPPPLLGADGEPPTSGFAGPDGQGRVFAVLVGVTTYYDAPLYGCADDATFLGDALESRGLADESAIWLLTDKDATRERLRNAIDSVAQAAGPDDLVLVFFSGHGNIRTAHEDDTTELDGTDETIVLANEEVVDNELIAWLDTINAGALMLAVDSCHSGGLARDFMTRPGRIGIFSSDEDVLSSTAEVVGSGGFLSYFLRRALAGYADGRPGDGALTVGELTDFILQGFIDQHTAMNPAASNAPYQRLVVERGSFDWNDVLLVFPRTFEGEEVPLPEDCWHSGPADGGATDGGSCR